MFSDDDLVLARVIYASVIAMQYHPRNNVPPERDPEIILRSLEITKKAVIAFDNAFVVGCVFDDGIPF